MRIRSRFALLAAMIPAVFATLYVAQGSPAPTSRKAALATVQRRHEHRTGTSLSADFYMGGYFCSSSEYCPDYVEAIVPDTGTPFYLNNSFTSSESFDPESIAVGTTKVFVIYQYFGLVVYDLGSSNPTLRLYDKGTLLAASSTDQLYDAHGNGINVYAPGATTPTRTITTGITHVVAMAVGRTDGLYVSNGTDIQVYAGHSSHPTRSITKGIDNATILAFDPLGQLLVYNAGSSSLSIYPLHATEPSTVIAGLPNVAWVSVGPTGTIYVLQRLSNLVSEFDREGRRLSRTIRMNSPVAAVVDAHDTLYALSAEREHPQVFIFPSGTTRRSKILKLPDRVRQISWAVGTPW